MTELLEKAVQTLRGLPPERQDDIARVVLMIAAEDEDQSVIQLTSEEAASLAISLGQADRREFATDEQIRAIWAKHGL